MMTEFASVVLLEDIETDSGSQLKEGTQGTLIGQEDGNFVVEFELHRPGDDSYFEAALLSTESFAITEILAEYPPLTDQ
jgi:hypothetical protein